MSTQAVSSVLAAQEQDPRDIQGITMTKTEDNREPEPRLPDFDPQQLFAPRLSNDNRMFLKILSDLPEAADDDNQPEDTVGTEEERTGLAALHLCLQRLRPLALRAANTGVLSLAELIADQQEADALIAEMRKIADAFPTGSLPRQLTPARLGAVEEAQTACTLADVASGRTASLRNHPVLALRIVRQAQAEVRTSQLRQEQRNRAEIRANLQALEATVANIIRTETYLRNVQMALEYAGLTGRQIEEQAGIACTAQDVPQPEAVLQLLQ